MMVEFIASLSTLFIFVLYIGLILFIMLFVSSYLAAIIMLFIPILLLLIVPEMSIGFLTYKQAEFLNGRIAFNNLHIVLFIWSTLIGIIIYTELVSWYISREIKKPEPNQQTGTKLGQINIPFKPLERFLQKFEIIIGKK